MRNVRFLQELRSDDPLITLIIIRIHECFRLDHIMSNISQWNVFSDTVGISRNETADMEAWDEIYVREHTASQILAVIFTHKFSFSDWKSSNMWNPLSMFVTLLDDLSHTGVLLPCMCRGHFWSTNSYLLQGTAMQVCEQWASMLHGMSKLWME
jgi:hypothetical protein